MPWSCRLIMANYWFNGLLVICTWSTDPAIFMTYVQFKYKIFLNFSSPRMYLNCIFHNSKWSKEVEQYKPIYVLYSTSKWMDPLCPTVILFINCNNYSSYFSIGQHYFDMANNFCSDHELIWSVPFSLLPYLVSDLSFLLWNHIHYN